MNSCNRGQMIYSVAFAPTGNLIASGTFYGDVRVWNAKTKKVLFDQRVYRSFVCCMAFSHDGKTLASCSSGGEICCWSTSTWQVECESYARCNMGRTSAFSPDVRTLAMVSTTDHNTILLWNTENASLKATLMVDHGVSISSIAFSPDGKTLAFGSTDNTVRIWDTGHRTRVLVRHKSWICSVAFSHNGRTLASASIDGPIVVCSVGTDKNTMLFTRLWHSHGMFLLRVVFAASDNTLAAFAADGTIYVWNYLRRATLMRKLQNAGHVQGVCFLPHGNTLRFCVGNGIDDQWPFFLGCSTMRALAPCLDVGVAPYVLLDIVNFLLANANKIRLVDEENFFHGKKIAFISQRQQRKVKR